MCDSKQPNNLARQFDDFRWSVHRLLMLARLAEDWLGRVVDPDRNGASDLIPPGYSLICGDERELIEFLLSQIEDHASIVDNAAALLDHNVTGRKV